MNRTTRGHKKSPAKGKVTSLPRLRSVRTGAPQEPIKATERLIVALDAPINPARRGQEITAEDAIEIVDTLGNLVEIVKVGWALFLSAGPEIVRRLRERDKIVFLDLKCGDIPETVKHLVNVAGGLEASFLTVDTTIQAVKAAVEANKSPKLKILTVTVLTSLDQADLRDMGLRVTVPQLAMLKARNARRVKCDGVIASGREAAAIRQMAGDDFLIITPGIRPAGLAHDDHKRAVTPEESIRNGADYLVVGRPITGAASPRDATSAILEEMQRAFDRHRR